MERYNYEQAIYDDVMNWIYNNYTVEEITEALEDPDDWQDELMDKLWIEDRVTGNASGSYYCNAWKAEESICHNFDLLAEAMEEFCCDWEQLKKGAEWADVSIRCYLLPHAIFDAVSYLQDRYTE